MNYVSRKTIHRTIHDKENYYTPISQQLLQSDLHPFAKGLLCEILGNKDYYVFHPTMFYKKFGRKLVEKAIAELIEKKYCTKKKISPRITEFDFFEIPFDVPTVHLIISEGQEKEEKIDVPTEQFDVLPVHLIISDDENKPEIVDVLPVHFDVPTEQFDVLPVHFDVPPVHLINNRNKKNNTLLTNSNNTKEENPTANNSASGIISQESFFPLIQNYDTMEKQIKNLVKEIQEETAIRIGCPKLEELPEFLKRKLDENIIAERWEKFTIYYGEKNNKEFTSLDLAENKEAVQEFGFAIVEQVLKLWKNQYPGKIPAKEKYLLFYLLKQSLNYEPSIILFNKFIAKIMADNEYDKRPLFIWAKAYTTFTGGEEANSEENKKQAEIAAYTAKKRAEYLHNQKAYSDLRKKETTPVQVKKVEKFVHTPNYGFIDDALVEKIKKSQSQ